MKKTIQKNKKISFDDEPLILVNEQDEEIGYQDKKSCHQGNGILHRAFSIFIFNEQGQLLMQKRSAQKTLWPLYWSNSCCSHPRKGELLEIATTRRLKEELGLFSELKFLFKFIYQASFREIGSEHELCYVYIGKSNGPVKTNVNEIAAWHFMDVENLNEEIRLHPENFTPWFKLEWEQMRNEWWNEIAKLWKKSQA
jgi:isopentenyl-diphosphate delta-isomerase